MSLFLNLLFETDSYSNEYLLAKIGFDTAENEPCKVCPLSAYRFLLQISQVPLEASSENGQPGGDADLVGFTPRGSHVVSPRAVLLMANQSIRLA